MTIGNKNACKNYCTCHPICQVLSDTVKYNVRSLPLGSMESIKVCLNKNLTHIHTLSSLTISLSLARSSLSHKHTYRHTHTHSPLCLSLLLSHTHTYTHTRSHTHSYTQWTEQIMYLEVFRWDPWKESRFVQIKLSITQRDFLLSLSPSHTHTHSSLSVSLSVSLIHTELYTVNWANYAVRSLPLGSMETINVWIKYLCLPLTLSSLSLCLSLSMERIKVCLNNNLLHTHSSLSVSLCLSPHLPISLSHTHTHTHRYIQWTEQIMLLEVFRWCSWK